MITASTSGKATKNTTNQTGGHDRMDIAPPSIVSGPKENRCSSETAKLQAR